MRMRLKGRLCCRLLFSIIGYYHLIWDIFSTAFAHLFFRYDNEPQEDVFEQLIREGDERMAQKEGQHPKDVAIKNGSQTQDNQDLLNHSSQTVTTKPALSDEQKQRMLKNRELAEEKRRLKQAEKSQTLLAEDSRIEDEDEK